MMMNFELIDPDVIPEMKSSLGHHEYWRQPDRSEIKIDGIVAKMAKNTFNALNRYDNSNPTGVYQGKMWRRAIFDADDRIICWNLVWFGEEVEGACNIYKKEIVIIS